MKAASIGDYREIARRRLPKFLFEYVDGGSYSETTLGKNIADLEDLSLRQRVLRDVSSIDTSTCLFERHMALPIVLAPVGLAGMNARRGEVQAVRAADAAGVPFCLSTLSVCSIKETSAAAVTPLWYQLYMLRDRGFMRDLLRQAREAGCEALLFTVDMPMPGTRYRDYRSGLAGATGRRGAMRRFAQAACRPRWAWDVGIRGRPHVLGNVVPVLGRKSGMEDFLAWMKTNFDPSVTWADLEFIRAEWDGPLVIKGILDADDARAAAAVGASGVVVSNHGGRQLDGVVSTIRALPRVADAVGDRLAVLADGGIRSGLDVVRMLACGAKAVLVGRAWAYALAARGGAGVSHVLSLFDAEMRVAMALTGTRTVASIGNEILERMSIVSQCEISRRGASI